MKTVWFQGIEKDRKKEIEDAFKSSVLFRTRLKELAEDKISIKLKARTTETDYESPSWPYKQADAVGYTRALNEIISLLEEK